MRYTGLYSIQPTNNVDIGISIRYKGGVNQIGIIISITIRYKGGVNQIGKKIISTLDLELS